MRTVLLALLALGCGTSTPDPGTSRAGCSDPPDGQAWAQPQGCATLCLPTPGNNSYDLCSVDGGAPVCIDTSTDPHHCGRCDRDCDRGACQPVGGVRYESSCRLSECVCRRL